MTDDERLRLKAALRIHDRLSREAREPPPAPLPPHEAWRDLVSSARFCSHARERGWAAAGAAARAAYRSAASDVLDRLSAWQRVLGSDERPRRIQSPREIIADLAALEAEFAEVEIDLKEQTVSATTDPVVLEGVDLGSFEVALRWDLPADAGAYSVIACDPHPCATDLTTTHPHVREETLCEGDAEIPIRRALEEGRLYDFFLLVRQTLTTYCAEGAYAPLSRWHGAPCNDCGRTPPEDESACCDLCQADLCTDCMTPCAECDRLCCSECRQPCGGCQRPFCPRCLHACRTCGGGERCGRCLHEGCDAGRRDPEHHHANELHEETDAIDNDAPDGETATAEELPGGEAEPSGPAVQRLRLGEAAVPA